VSVYVDTLLPCIKNSKWRYCESCHLVADTTEELHAFAEQLGLKRSWFQNNRRLPHYDLTKNMRAKAVRLGAVEISRNEFVSMMKPRICRGQLTFANTTGQVKGEIVKEGGKYILRKAAAK